MDTVLANHGLYRDRDLYNFVAGAATPDGKWSEKTTPKRQPFSVDNLNKLRLSVPCFVGIVPETRAAIRRFYHKRPLQRALLNVMDNVTTNVKPLRVKSPPKTTVSFYASMTHGQRADAVRLLRGSKLLWAWWNYECATLDYRFTQAGNYGFISQ
jgi:hypothetical protein